MIDYLELGPTPAGESCAQVGEPDYAEKGRAECQRYVEQLRRQFGEAPAGGGFRVKSFPHDFGSYYEAVVVFDDNVEASMDFAFNVERNLPEHWDDQ